MLIEKDIKEVKSSVLTFYKYLYIEMLKIGIELDEEQKKEQVLIDKELDRRDRQHLEEIEEHKRIMGNGGGW